MADDDLGEILFPRIGQQVRYHGAAGQGDGVGAEFLRQAQAAGQAVAGGVWQGGVGGGFQMDDGPGHAQPFREAAAVADQRVAAGMVDADQNAVAGRPGAGNGVRLHVVAQLGIDALGGAAQGEFAQGGEVAGGEIMRQRAARGAGQVDFTGVQALDQVVRGEVDQFDFIGGVDDAIGHGFAHPDAGDLRHDVVEACDMLDVEGGVDVDAGGEQVFDIGIALRVAAAGGVGVGELIDQGQGWAAGEQGVEVHFVQRLALIGDVAAGHGGQAGQQGFGFGPAMGFHHADDDIDAVALTALGGEQHGVGFADAGGGAEEEVQLAAPVGAGGFQQGLWRGAAVTVGHGAWLRSFGRGIQSQVQSQHIDPPFTQQPQQRFLGMGGDQGGDGIIGQMPGFGHPGDLEGGGGGGDMRV